jgi:hypothetical protein
LGYALRHRVRAFSDIDVEERPMIDPTPEAVRPDELPLGQRLFDNIFLLLGAGLLVMFVLYTGWGLWEILTLPTAPLP